MLMKQGGNNSIVPDLLEQPCNNSDNINKAGIQIIDSTTCWLFVLFIICDYAPQKVYILESTSLFKLYSIFIILSLKGLRHYYRSTINFKI